MGSVLQRGQEGCRLRFFLLERAMAPKKEGKKIAGLVRLQVPAGKANPAPPIGTVLGPRGVNIMEFCKSFNAQTQAMDAGTPIPVIMTIFSDKSFVFVMRNPPNSFFLKKAAHIEKGSQTPGRGGGIATLTMAQIREIAEKKMPDLNCHDIDAACRMLAGSARSMGIVVTA